MKIEDVIKESIVAIFSDRDLGALQHLVLKGGSALRLSEGIDQRLSTDIDFSTPELVAAPATFFQQLQRSLERHFAKLGFDVIDCKSIRKPRRQAAKDQGKWGGWNFSFKLVSAELHQLSFAKRQKAALVPEGAAGSTIHIEISEWEYCDGSKRFHIGDTSIAVYTGAVLVLEKLRAICQQHSTYRSGRPKNRARDFYDIYQLLRKYRANPGFILELKSQAGRVFAAKTVPLDLLDRIFEQKFLDVQRTGFPEVQATVRSRLQPFDFYVEQLRILAAQLQAA